MSRSFLSTVVLSLIAVIIIAGTFFYSGYLSERIATSEKKQMQEWVTAQRLIAAAEVNDDLSLPSVIVAEQQQIPIIETNEKDSILNFLNIDSQLVLRHPSYLYDQLKKFKQSGHVILTYLDLEGRQFNKYYYGESSLIAQIRYFPLIQLFIVVLFIAVLMLALRYKHKTEQERLWTGLAKETAHQLGTPISALSGWIAMLRETSKTELVLNEMDKDIKRLELITERFSMIGSKPKKMPTDIVALLSRTIDYIRKRAATQIELHFVNHSKNGISIQLAAPLIEWVIENLLKNALDAIEDGKGVIEIDLSEVNDQVIIDITDNGKGISPSEYEAVFRPGYSTKKRGWGLGLTLSKRIIEENHGGQLFIRSSELSRGTTFRIILKK